MEEEKLFINKSTLTDMSNHVRAKGGTSAPLSIPEGFNAAVDAIETGGGGIQHIETGTENGTISVDGENVAIKGLDSAAYTPSSDYVKKESGVTSVDYNVTDKKITKTINGNITDIVTLDKLKQDMGITGAMNYIGITTSELDDGSVLNPIIINDNQVTAKTGDVVITSSSVSIKANTEFIWSNNVWNQFGEPGDFALKTELGSLAYKNSATGSVTPIVSVTGSDYTPSGSVTSPVITVVPSKTRIKATSSNIQISGNGNVDVLTGVKLSGSATALTGVKASGTDSFVKSYPGVSKKIETTKVTGVNGKTNASKVKTSNEIFAGNADVGEQVTCDDITSWDAGSHTASIQNKVMIGASCSDGVLSLNFGEQSHSYVAPKLQYSEKTVNSATETTQKVNNYTFSDVDVPVANTSPTFVATGKLVTTGTGESVLTGLGTAVSGNAITGVQANGEVSVPTGIEEEEKVSVLTSVGVTAQPVITLTKNAEETDQNAIQIVDGITSASSGKIEFNGTPITITPNVVGSPSEVTVS